MHQFNSHLSFSPLITLHIANVLLYLQVLHIYHQNKIDITFIEQYECNSATYKIHIKKNSSYKYFTNIL